MADVQTPPSSTAAGLGELGLQKHYINGQFRASISGATFETLDPTTNEPLALAADGGEEDVAAAVAAARPAFDSGPWPRRTPAARAAAPRPTPDPTRRHAAYFSAREGADIGMPVAQMKGLAARAAQNF